ncbi:hypothetical protein HPB50_007730 [Hyalomma asiaticum]|uniref:Uncharacterized protein n=1 Tax=Hyalomma asiaticum TaxID=266040 RepID=A0ACB7RYP8_HYAAI|nr:hypothetical protein HPB50_007730 [Hyalomma asiaticum]
MQVLDMETGKPLGPMNPGELVIRGGGLMRGYWGKLDDDYTDTQGWYKTGDVCYFDHDEWLYLVQRLSDSLYCRGSKISPAEIESTLLASPDVRDCVVVGLPHEEAGQVPHAIIVPERKSRHLGPDHYVKFVDANMPRALRLEGGVTLVDEIPRNKLGKFVRRNLVDWVLQKRNDGISE